MNSPETFGSTRSWIIILVILIQILPAFFRLPATANQFSSPSFSTLPRYLNDVTVSNGSPWAFKALYKISRRSSSTRCMHILSTPLMHWAVERCQPLSACQGTIMLHRGHRGWWGLTSSTSLVCYYCLVLLPCEPTKLVPSWYVQSSHIYKLRLL